MVQDQNDQTVYKFVNQGSFMGYTFEILAELPYAPVDVQVTELAIDACVSPLPPPPGKYVMYISANF